MRTRIPALMLSALLLATVPAFAADVDGTWTGSIETPNGTVPLSFTFKADGAKLTGSTQSPDGQSVPLKNGKIEGEKISFSFDVDFGQGPFTFNYTGVVSKTEVKLHSDFMGNPIDFTLKKPAG
jgi:hypothetical protein